MRIVQIVTLVSPDSAYGGPVRVALNQARALIDSGHEVTVLAGCRGYRNAPTEIDGVPVRLFPVRARIPRTGFAGLTAPGLTRELKRLARTADVVHIHLARDLVTLPAARAVRRLKVPYVVQCHGMIDRSSRLMSYPLDVLLTRPVLRSAARVFVLTPREHADLVAVAGTEIALAPLINGVPVSGHSKVRPGQHGVEVLYLARLHARKRPADFVAAAVHLIEQDDKTTFALVGPDEGEGAAVAQAIARASTRDRIVWEGAISPDRSLERMRRAALFVLPSVDEPFPMSVLEAMSLGLPVIVTDSCGLAPDILRADAGRVTDGSVRQLIEAIREITEDQVLRARLGRNAIGLAQSAYSMDAVRNSLQMHYADMAKGT